MSASSIKSGNETVDCILEIYAKHGIGAFSINLDGKTCFELTEYGIKMSRTEMASIVKSEWPDYLAAYGQ